MFDVSKIPNYESHPGCLMLPELSTGEMDELCENIKENGLRVPIWLHKGQILDGRHRFAACKRVGVMPLFQEYRGSEPIKLIISLNIHRRHLDASDRVMLIANFMQFSSKPGPKAATVFDDTIDPAPVPELLTSSEMAQLAQVSERTVRNAKSILNNGTEELKEEVKNKKLTVTQAAKIASKPKAKQKSEIDKAKEEKPKKTAAKKAEKPAVPPEPSHEEGDPVKDLEKAYKEIDQLEAKVDSLSKTDQGKEVIKWMEKFRALEGRLAQCMTTCKEAEKQATYYGQILTKVRKALKVEHTNQILEAIRQLQ